MNALVWWIIGSLLGLLVVYLGLCFWEAEKKGVSTLYDGCEPFGGEIR